MPATFVRREETPPQLVKLNQFIDGVDECQTDCQRAGKNSRAHREDTVFEVFHDCVPPLLKIFRAQGSKDFVETVEKNQSDDKRRAEKSRAPHQQRRVLFEIFLHDLCLLSCSLSPFPWEQREVYHEENFWQYAIIIVSWQIRYRSLRLCSRFFRQARRTKYTAY